MRNCQKCGRALTKEGRLPSHFHTIGGSDVELIDSASKLVCECGEIAIDIPNFTGLVAAVALGRALQPMKLSGPEIRFLRKAMGLKAMELAKTLNVSAEAVSRWEAGTQPMSPQNELVFRFFAASLLKEQAPAMDVKPEDVLRVKLSPFRDGSNAEPMKFEIVRLKREGQKTPQWDTTTDEAA